MQSDSTLAAIAGHSLVNQPPTGKGKLPNAINAAPDQRSKSFNWTTRKRGLATDSLHCIAALATQQYLPSGKHFKIVLLNHCQQLESHPTGLFAP